MFMLTLLSWTILGTEPKSQATGYQLKKHIYNYVNIHWEQQNLCSSFDNRFGEGMVVVELRVGPKFGPELGPNIGP